MEDLDEDIEPKIDCNNTTCEECGLGEWCNTYQDELYKELWGDEDDDYCDNEYEDINN